MQILSFETSVGSKFDVQVSNNFETGKPQFVFILQGNIRINFTEEELKELNLSVLPLVMNEEAEQSLLDAAASEADSWKKTGTGSTS